MQDNASQQFRFGDRLDLAVERVIGHVGQPARTVAADAVARQAGELHVEEFWHQLGDDAAAEAAAEHVVIANRGNRRWDHRVGAVIEIAQQAIAFEMQPAVGDDRVDRGLADEIRDLVLE